MGLELLFLLLPVAALTGWLLGRSHTRRQPQTAGLAPEYFKGLSYLLNEQPDRAIEIFTRMLEVNSDTVEVHLALGNLFRQRGEVERSIRIHQNLIARPALSTAQRGQALFELAQDYMRAGLLDRAENLFTEVSHHQEYATLALQQLIDIYQQEKDWQQAITISKRLENISGQRLNQVVAHYYCELAEQANRSHEYTKAIKMVKQALSTDRNCARASIIEGDLLREVNKISHAIRAYKRVENQDPSLISEVAERLVECYRRTNKQQELLNYLHALYQRYGDETVMQCLAGLLLAQQGEQAALKFIGNHLRKQPSISGISQLLKLNQEVAPSQAEEVVMLGTLVEQILEDRPSYQCGQCGFAAKSLYWQCPSCKHWDTSRRIQGIS